MGPQRDKHLPPNPFTGRFLRKDDLLGFGVFIIIWSMLLRLCTATEHLKTVYTSLQTIYLVTYYREKIFVNVVNDF
jgi:hypothetical protein